jgi:hypothetical protein
MTQPTPSVSEADVERVLTRDFSDTDLPAARAIVLDYGRESHEIEPDRVRLAALKLAAGDVQALRRHVDVAKMDFRDALLAAEYPKAGKFLSRMDRLSAEKRQEIYDADWKQYEDWLRRT